MRLYKYLNINLNDLSGINSYFENLKFSIPKNLNDPFEGFFLKKDFKKRIGCLSKTKPYGEHDSIYMWSFYANGLKGICIEFEFKQHRDNNFESRQMSYVNKFQKNFSLFTKYKSWESENEYRFVLKPGKKMLLPISELGLRIKAIYIGVGVLGGMKINVKTRNNRIKEHNLYKKIEGLSLNIPVYVCVRNRNKFLINRVKL
jgi:hypothetical protein